MPLKPCNAMQNALISPRLGRRGLEATKSDGGENSSSKENFRIVMLGLCGVGKSALASHFIQPKSPKRSRQSSDELHHVQYSENGQTYSAELLDTSDYQNYPAMRELAIRQGHAFVLVCSVDMENSFEHVKALHQEILHIKQSQNQSAHPPIVVVANKTDLDKSLWTLDIAYAELTVNCDWEECGFISCSASDPHSVRGLFTEIVTQINVSFTRENGMRPFTQASRRKSMPNFLEIPMDALKRTPSFPRKKKVTRTNARSDTENPSTSLPACHVQ